MIKDKDLIQRTAQMSAHLTTRCLLASFTLEEAIEAVEEAAQHVAHAGGNEVEKRTRKNEPHADDIVDLTAAIINGIREGHKENWERNIYGG